MNTEKEGKLKNIIIFASFLYFGFNFTTSEKSAAITKAFDCSYRFNFMASMTLFNAEMTEHI